MGSRIGRPAGLLLALLVALGAPARAQQQGAAEIFQTLNDQTSAIYQTTKQRFLAAADPVVMVGYDSGAFDSVMIRQGGETRHLGQTPHAYHVLKTVGHVPRSIWAALRPATEGLDPQGAWRSQLAGLRPLVVAAQAALPDAGLSRPRPRATRSCWRTASR